MFICSGTPGMLYVHLSYICFMHHPSLTGLNGGPLARCLIGIIST